MVVSSMNDPVSARLELADPLIAVVGATDQSEDQGVSGCACKPRATNCGR